MLLSLVVIAIIFIVAKNNLDNSIRSDIPYSYRHMHEGALLGIIQIILMILMSLTFSISLIYLIFTKGGKLSFKEAFVNSDKITIAILETIILTLSVTSINTMIANKINNEDDSYPVRQININNFDDDKHNQNDDIIRT